MKFTEIACDENSIKELKTLLKVYRPVAYNKGFDGEFLFEELLYRGCKHLPTVIGNNIAFDSSEEEKEFYDKLERNEDDLNLILLLKKTLETLKDYPERKKFYYEILQLLYFDRFDYTNDEAIEQVHLSRTSYYRRLKEAYNLYYKNLILVIRSRERVFKDPVYDRIS